jgi:hypothetical protein
MENDDSDANDNNVKQDKLCIGDDPHTLLDQYLGGEDLK